MLALPLEVFPLLLALQKLSWQEVLPSLSLVKLMELELQKPPWEKGQLALVLPAL